MEKKGFGCLLFLGNSPALEGGKLHRRKYKTFRTRRKFEIKKTGSDLYRHVIGPRENMKMTSVLAQIQTLQLPNKILATTNLILYNVT